MGVVSVPSEEEFDALKAKVEALEAKVAEFQKKIENWDAVLVKIKEAMGW